MSTTSTLRGVLSDAAIHSLQQRNAARMSALILRLGPDWRRTRWLLASLVGRQAVQPPVLQRHSFNRRAT